MAKHRYQQDLSNDSLKIAWCQFSDVKVGHQVMGAVGLFDNKMHILYPNYISFSK